ncbi:DUF2946 domain-containing protein [Rugamonas sp.]|uniref:DUF2946 domain-containing protein n=1 Tax=Rugamonas sp. TaxID=1926287 RepID=UPI0025E10F29|nr:DUF2946 domain-containing protein [Rugamonas sp.]
MHIWIACFAILLNALVPSISHALDAMQSHSPQIEICTADGIKYIALDGSTPEKSPLDSILHHVEHCPYCVSDAAAPPLPTTYAPALPVTSAMAPMPSLFYLSPAPLFSWSQSHPRAPPAA